MIVRFSFSNFKSIKEKISLSFEASRSTELEEYYVVRPTPKLRLLKLAAIYGPNASGKSNVLLALEFVRRLTLEPEQDKLRRININQFAFTDSSDKGASNFQLDFVERGIRYSYRLAVTRNHVLSEDLYFFDPNKALLYSRVTEPVSGKTTIKVGSKLQVAAEDLRLWQLTTLPNNSVLGSYIKVNINVAELAPVIEWFRDRLTVPVWPKSDLSVFIHDLIKSNVINKSAILSLLKKADMNIQGLEFPDNFQSMHKNLSAVNRNLLEDLEREYTVNSVGGYADELRDLVFLHTIKDNNGKKITYGLPYALQSAGTRRYYEYAGLLTYLLKEGKILPIDELESSLHPDLLKHFLLLFLRNSKNSQLLFTTHQRDLMRETDMLRNDIFHFTEKRSDGSTELFSFTDFDSSVVRSDSSLYNAYKIGKLGAIPELGDTYIPAE